MSETNPLTELLRPHVKALMIDAAAGDRNAKQVITMYQMYCSSQMDPGAPTFCREFFKAWLTDRSKP